MTTKNRIRTTTEEMQVATQAARRRERLATKIRAASYDRASDAIRVDMSTGATLIVPRHRILGFAAAAPKELADLAVTPGAEGLWSDTVDDGVLLEQLLVFAAGETLLGRLGARLNAAIKSPARAAASRTNGTKGGRPRKPAA